MLVHGFAEDSDIWKKQVAFLKKDFLLIIPDLPGSGQSSLLDKKDAVMEDYADCIREILLEEKIDRCIMIGHSMGGYITLAFAEKFPESLITFGLFHSTAYADDETKKETRRKAIAFIEANGAEAFLKTSIPGLFYDQGNSGPADTLLSGQATVVARPLYEKLIEKASSFSKRALIQYYHAMITRPGRTHILRDSKNPVLFIAGEYDKAVPFRHSLEQSHIPDRSYISVLRNSAHMGMLEEPGRCNEILAYFLLNQ